VIGLLDEVDGKAILHFTLHSWSERVRTELAKERFQ
jgi:hypothetical protein